MTTLEAMRVIAEHYNLQAGDYFKVTINAVGDPSVEYSRKITKERVEEEL